MAGFMLKTCVAGDEILKLGNHLDFVSTIQVEVFQQRFQQYLLTFHG